MCVNVEIFTSVGCCGQCTVLRGTLERGNRFRGDDTAYSTLRKNRVLTAVGVADVVAVERAVVVAVVTVLVAVPVGVDLIVAERLQRLQPVQRQVAAGLCRVRLRRQVTAAAGHRVHRRRQMAAGRHVPLWRLVHAPHARRSDDRRPGRLKPNDVGPHHRVQR